jgi:hypothetical protein
MKNSRTLAVIEDGLITGRATAHVNPRQDVTVPASGECEVHKPGGKCEHGVYIPATSSDANRAPNCSICHPYEIVLKKNATFLA